MYDVKKIDYTKEQKAIMNMDTESENMQIITN